MARLQGAAIFLLLSMALPFGNGFTVAAPTVGGKRRLPPGASTRPSTQLLARGLKLRGNDESKRQARVAQLIQEEIANIIHHGAIKTREPLEEDLRDNISVIDVHMTPDLLSAKVFVSVYGDAAAKREAFTWLVDHAGKVKHALAQSLSGMKRVPDVHFKQMDVCSAVDLMATIDRLDSGHNDGGLPRGMIDGIDFDNDGDGL